MAIPILASTPTQTTACPTCGGVDFWESLQSRLFCLSCTKPPRSDFVKRRLRRLPDGSLSDLTEIEFRERYPAETWDWWEHMEPGDLEHMQQRPVQDPCPWCGVRGERHAPACERLHDEWDIRIAFGKYKGRKLKELDPGYLKFLLGWDKLTWDLRKEISRILKVPIPDRFYLKEVHDDGL